MDVVRGAHQPGMFGNACHDLLVAAALISPRKHESYTRQW